MTGIRAGRSRRSADLSKRQARIRAMDRRKLFVSAAAGAVGLALDPFGRVAHASGGTPSALVTADLEGHVVLLNLRGGRIVSRFETAPGPRSIEGIGVNAAIVGHTEIGVVSILELERGLRLRAELEGFEAPRYAAVHPRRACAYVSDSAREEVVVIHPGDARVLWRARVPGPARHIAVSADGRTVWTALGTKAARIAVLDASDPRRPKLVRTFAPPFLAHDVVFAPDGRTVWVTSGEERRIALYGAERSPARILDAGAPPQHVTFARDKAFVASGDDGTVRRHRLNGRLVREARVPVGSYNIAFGFERLVTPSLSRGTIALLDGTGQVAWARTVARAAHDACVLYGPLGGSS